MSIVRSRTEYSLLNILTSVLGFFITTLLGFISRIVFVHSLSADYLGVNGLFLNIIAILSLSELGVGSAVSYALYKPIAQNNIKKIASIMAYMKKLYLIIGSAIFIIGLALIPFLDLIIKEKPQINESIYTIYILYLFGSSISYLFSYKSILLLAMQKNYIVIGYSYIISLLQTVLQIGILLIWKNYLLFLCLQILCTFTYNVWISNTANKLYPFLLGKNISPISSRQKIILFRNVRAITVSKLSGILVNNTGNIIISAFCGVVSVGIVSNYILFSRMLDSLVTKIFSSLTGSIGNHNALASSDERLSFFKVLQLGNFWLYGWGALGIFFLSSDLVALCFGDNYVLSSKIPFIIGLNLFTLGMLHSSYTYKSTLGLFRYGEYLLLATGIINIFFSILLTRLFGVIGVFLASLIARLATTVWYEPFVVFKHGLKKNFNTYIYSYIKYILILALCTAVTFVCCYHINGISLIPRFIFKLIICILIPNILFYLIFKNSIEFTFYKNIATNLFRNKLSIKKRVS